MPVAKFTGRAGGSDAYVTFKSNLPAIKQKVALAILEAVTEVFELYIVPEAKRRSPVKTGTNRRSIDVTIKTVAGKVTAMMFTQSGYGGFLEVGTRYMQAQPYMYPAYKKYEKKLYSTIRAKIKAIR